MNKKLTIGIVLPSIISKNGTAKQSIELAKVLETRGHTIQFFTFAYHPKTSFPEFDNFQVHYCVNVAKSLIYKMIKNISLLETIYLYLGLVFIYKFRRLFKGKRIDILNPHDWMGIWVVSSLHDKAKIVANINDIPDRQKGNILNKVKLFIDRRCVGYIDQIIALDNKSKKMVVKWLGMNEGKISVIRSGIDIKKYQYFHSKIDIRTLFAISKDVLVVACANLLAPNRRYEDVLLAIARLDAQKYPVHAMILSKLDFNKNYAEYLRRIIKEKHLEKKVHFVDKFFSDEERMTYIQSADILVFSNAPQTWGLTVIEAMALGIPVIVSDGSGVSEVLEDGVTALVYKAKNVSALEKKIRYCFEKKSVVGHIAKNAKTFVLQNYSWERFGLAIENRMVFSITNIKS